MPSKRTEIFGSGTPPYYDDMARRTRLASIMIMHDGTSTIFQPPRVSRLGSTGSGLRFQSSGHPSFPTLIDKRICSDNWVVPVCDAVSAVKIQSGPRLNSMQHLPSKDGSKYVYYSVGTMDKARLSPTKGVIIVRVRSQHVSTSHKIQSVRITVTTILLADIGALLRHALTYRR